MYVEDAVEAYLTLAGNVGKRAINGEAFNFGTGKPISVIDLFRIIARLCGRPKSKPKILATAKNEIDRQYLGIAKAKKVLGWKPEFSLEQGLKRTIDWYRRYIKT